MTSELFIEVMISSSPMPPRPRSPSRRPLQPPHPAQAPLAKSRQEWIEVRGPVEVRVYSLARQKCTQSAGRGRGRRGSTRSTSSARGSVPEQSHARARGFCCTKKKSAKIWRLLFRERSCA